jgi:replicative DNA helicase
MPKLHIAEDQLLPTNQEAERMLLGVILLSNETLAEVAAHLRPEHFFYPSHRSIFKAMLRLASGGHIIDPLSLQDELARAGLKVLEQVGGPAYISMLHDGVPRFSNVESYLRLIKDSAAEREMMEAGSRILSLATDTEMSITDKILRIQSIVSKIEDPNVKLQWRGLGELAAERMNAAEEFAASGRVYTGMPTGFTSIDYLMDGMQKTDLIIIAGRPSMGKSALIAGMSYGAAKHETNDRPVVAYFTLEMSKNQLTDRFLSMESGICVKRIQQGTLKTEEWRAVAQAREKFDALRIHIDDESCITPNGIRVKCRDLKRREGRLDLICLDYIQGMMADRPSGHTTQDVTNISKHLKSIAKDDFGVPLLAAASMNRAPESRSDKRPSMAELRESGQLESDADVIALLYRDDYYNRDSPRQNIAEVDFQKQRNGPTGQVELCFLRQLAKFENLYKG